MISLSLNKKKKTLPLCSGNGITDLQTRKTRSRLGQRLGQRLGPNFNLMFAGRNLANKCLKKTLCCTHKATRKTFPFTDQFVHREIDAKKKKMLTSELSPLIIPVFQLLLAENRITDLPVASLKTLDVSFPAILSAPSNHLPNAFHIYGFLILPKESTVIQAPSLPTGPSVSPFQNITPNVTLSLLERAL